jgi:hypothetical protein
MANKLAVAAGFLRTQCRRPVRFIDSWWLPLGLGTLMGAMLVFIVLFLEPMGTDRYTASFRTLRLMGYGPCVVLSFLMIHGLSRWWVEKTASVWRLGHELLALALLILLAFNLCYFYLTWVINQQPVVFRQWFGFMYALATPFLLLLIPPGLLARRWIVGLIGDRAGEARVVIEGRNKDDRLRLAASDFLFAAAEQNYVTLHYIKKGQPCEQMLRATLSEIEQQLPNAMRVHRSYLLNRWRVASIDGPSRKRVAKLDGTVTEVPISSRFDIDLLSPPPAQD